MFHLTLILFPHDIVPHTVFIHINDILQLLFQYDILRLINNALKYRILYPLSVIRTDFATRASLVLPPQSVYSRHK